MVWQMWQSSSLGTVKEQRYDNMDLIWSPSQQYGGGGSVDGLVSYSTCVQILNEFCFESVSIDMLIFLFLGLFVFLLGVAGLIVGRENIMKMFFALEIMFLGVSVEFLVVSAFSGDVRGVICTFVLLGVAAAESALGLSLAISFYNLNKTMRGADVCGLFG